MIGLTFTLAGLALLMLQLLATDTLAAYQEIRRTVLADFDHDTKIFPDETPFNPKLKD